MWTTHGEELLAEPFGVEQGDRKGGPLRGRPYIASLGGFTEMLATFEGQAYLVRESADGAA